MQRDETSPPSRLVGHASVVVVLVLTLATLLRQNVLFSIGDRPRQPASQIEEPLLDSEITDPVNAGKRGRFVALDAFRGVTLCLMVFVNYGGGGFPAFKHSVWDGLTVADLVFPWFAWILGFSVFVSSSRHRTIRFLGQRSVKLFTLGLFVNNGVDWNHWRIPGVLQALSVAYFVVAVADWALPWHQNKVIKQPRTLDAKTSFVACHFAFGILPLVLGNLLLTFGLHVPGCPTGYLGPGGDAEGGAYRNCTGGAHLFVDKLVFGLDHIFQTPTCQQRYRTGPYDPEGVMNWMMVATTAYFGYLSGVVCMESGRLSAEPWNRLSNCSLRWTTVCGCILVFLGIVCGGLFVFQHGPWIPLNKNLWSLSYVLLSSGLASILLACFLKLLNNNAMWSGSPFISVGKNSVAIYVMHEICQGYAPFEPKPLQVGEGVSRFEQLLFNLVGVAWWAVVAQWMEKREIFLKA